MLAAIGISRIVLRMGEANVHYDEILYDVMQNLAFSSPLVSCFGGLRLIPASKMTLFLISEHFF